MHGQYIQLMNEKKYRLISLFKKDKLVAIRWPGGGGVLDISLSGEVRPGSSYPDPV